MSRRTRIKSYRRGKKGSMSHHMAYSESDSYFPSSFSLIGQPVCIPKNILPFVEHTTINFSGKISQFYQQSLKYQLHNQSIQTINLFIEGQILRNYNCKIAHCVMFTGLVCLIPMLMLKSSWMRQKFFTKYVFNSYEEIISIIHKYKNLKTLILNIQDNMFDDSKAEMLEQALLKSSVTKIVLRNHCYYIECNCNNFNKFFCKIKTDRNRSFKFIWEYNITKTITQPKDETELSLTFNQQ